MPGEIVVKFQPHVTTLGALGSLQREGLRSLDASSHQGLIRVGVESGQEAEMMAALAARGDVEFVALNHRVQALGDPNDPGYALQWGLTQIQDHDINAAEAWDFSTGGSDITIAIIDSGVDLDHPDLQAKIVPGYDFVNLDSLADDDYGHGTHVAGIAAAVSNNGLGITGVSWGAKIMPLKMLNASGTGTTFNLAKAIYFAVDNGAQVINMSLGASCGSGWPEVEDAVDYAVAKGVLLIAAAGNNQPYVFCPAAIADVVAVGATSATDVRASFSNYGPELEVVAPGVDIYSTLVGGGYGTKNGTSMAAPFVAGLAALLRSSDPALTAGDVTTVIQNTSDDLGSPGWDPLYGHGRINAWRALAATSLQTSPKQLTLDMDNQSGPVTGQIEVTTNSPEVIAWTATISPTVSWLNLASPAAGNLSTASASDGITVVATPPQSFDTHTTTIIIAGTTASNMPVGPKSIEIELNYTSKLYKFHLPVIYRN
ncbi:MAG TPA: S8 family peptidase [Anaerolineae bacterium]